MSTDHFVKVFDVLDSGFRNWTFSAIGLIFVAVGIAMFAFPKLIKALGIPYFGFDTGWKRLARYFFLGFAILWTALAFSMTYFAYLHHKALARENGCRIAEGPVEHFAPMPYEGHAQNHSRYPVFRLNIQISK